MTDASGKVLFTSQPVATTLNVLTTLSTVDLGNLDTTGFALGDDTITVTVADASGNPIPGATGKGTLLIGTPVTATLSTTPTTLPAGNGTVTSTLQINSQTSFTSPLSVLSQTAISGASGVAINGTLAYVGISDGIDVVDISDPTKPNVLSTFGASDLHSGLAVEMQVYNNELVVLDEEFSGPSYLLVYSLATPMSPTFKGQTPLTLPATLLPTGSARSNDTALYLSTISNNQVFADALSYGYFIGSGMIFAQLGESIDIDISDPTNPKVASVIYNDPPSPSTVYPGAFPFATGYPDGTSNTWQAAAVNAQTLLIGTTTATMATLTGVQGLVMVVDTTDPSNPSIVEKLAIPGMAVVTGIVVQGNQAFVIGSSQYWGNGVSGLAGNAVVATLDLTNPQDPKVVSTQTLGVASIGISSLQSLGNGLYVTSYDENAKNQTNTPGLLLLDASNPQNVTATVVSVPAIVISTNLTASGNLMFTVDGSNLLIYNIGQASSTPVAAQVTIPHGVSPVASSFSVAPTTTTTNADGSQTLVWDLGLSASNTSQTITWQSNITGLQAGQSLPVEQSGTVTFTSQGTPATLNLPDQFVAGDQIIGLDPATQTVAPGAAASYTVNLVNPTNQAVTYTLSVQGVPSNWVTLASTVMVAANGSASVPLTLTSASFAALGDEGFSVTATGDNGATSSVSGDLVLQGQPVLPDTNSHGVVVTLVPTEATAGQGTSASYVVEVTNTGSADDTFSLQVSGLPQGVTATLGQTTIDVPPGTSNYRDISLILMSSDGTPPGPVPFTVTAAAGSTATTGSASGTLNVVASGVSVTLSPETEPPGQGFQLEVTNTGTSTDTFQLALAGPAALVASLNQSKVTLPAGGSTAVPITTTEVNFADAEALMLMASAVSTTNPSVEAVATSSLTIPTTPPGLSAQFSPASQSLSKPGPATLLLDVSNTGNTEGTYSATILGTSGPVMASLVGLDGNPTGSIPLFRLPGLSTGNLARSRRR